MWAAGLSTGLESRLWPHRCSRARGHNASALTWEQFLSHAFHSSAPNKPFFVVLRTSFIMQGIHLSPQEEKFFITDMMVLWSSFTWRRGKCTYWAVGCPVRTRVGNQASWVPVVTQRLSTESQWTTDLTSLSLSVLNYEKRGHSLSSFTL